MTDLNDNFSWAWLPFFWVKSMYLCVCIYIYIRKGMAAIVLGD